MINPKSEYLFLLVGYDWHKSMPPADAKDALDKMMAWVDGLMTAGIATGARPLARTGKMVAGKNGSVVADGPFAEAKEVVGGYISVKADSLEEATVIARQCPLLEHGIKIDVREMVDECAISKGLREAAELAHA